MLLKNELIFGEIYLRMKDLKSSVNKEKEGYLVIIKSKWDFFFLGTLEKNETSFLSEYKRISFVLHGLI